MSGLGLGRQVVIDGAPLASFGASARSRGDSKSLRGGARKKPSARWSSYLAQLTTSDAHTEACLEACGEVQDDRVGVLQGTVKPSSIAFFSRT